MRKPTQQVILLTYNQEKYLNQCLDSIVDSSVLPWKVTIFDDFSTDRTRDIIESYRSRHPDLFEVVLNNKNLGIYGNLNQIKKFGKGDLIHNMAGDDWFSTSFFEEIEHVYLNKKIYFDDTNFIIIPSFSYAKENGTVFKIEKRSFPPCDVTNIGFSAFLRDKIIHRYSGLSRAFFSHYPERIDASGYLWWDRYYYLAHFLNIGNVYFAPKAVSYYRVGAGVASKASASEMLISHTSALISFLEDYSPCLDASDVEYILYTIYEMHKKYQKSNAKKIKNTFLALFSRLFL